jgi:hypothetical protein
MQICMLYLLHILVTSEYDRKVLDSCPGFEFFFFFLVNIVTGLSIKVYWNDGDVLCELQRNECTDMSESRCSSNSKIIVTIPSCDERVSSVKEKMALTTVACNVACGHSQMLSNHCFHLLADMA